MNVQRLSKVVMIAIVIAGVAVLFQLTAVGQCSMCRASLAGSGNASFIRQFNIGVLVLLVPPVAMFCSIFLVLRRHRVLDEPRSEFKETDR